MTNKNVVKKCYNILRQKGKVVLKYLGEKKRRRKVKGHFWVKRVPPKSNIQIL